MSSGEIKRNMMKVFLRRQPDTFNVEVYLVDHITRDTIIFYHFKEDGGIILTEEKYEAGESLNKKPTIVMPEAEVRDLLRAFTVAAKEELGISESESYVSGKLEATDKHLEDMRKLLKLK